MISNVDRNELSPHQQSQSILSEELREYRYYHSECALCGLLQKEPEGGGGGEDDESKQFQFCGKCRVVVYCSRDHQISHWKVHKSFCKANEWKRDNPAVSAASAACSYVNCRCRSWIPESNLHDKSICKSPDDEEIRPPSMTSSSATIPFQHRNNMQPISGQTQQQTKLWMLQVWQQVIEDMNRYGVCVVDNLLGEARGAAVLREVQSMYSSGAFQDGQLVKGKDNSRSKSIRGDKITWVDGREPNCKNISVLIKLLDNIVMGANTVTNNGKLGSYCIKERSKAMVACYPGSGTHYVKHVDNPNDDGRCVTAIYYLNKDWNTSENGGLLRIFPEGWAHQVADIEPLFDRVIFFWSDRRNPHEVQPAFKTRYAITLWYFDSNAKERARITTERESNKLPALQPVS